MIYLENTTESQRVFIPRTNIEASAYHPSTGGTEQYYAGQNIEITPNNVINVTGLTEAIENTISGMTFDYATTGDVETMISAATSDFVTSGDVQSQITSQTQNLVTSGDVETMISAATSGMVTTEALTAYTPTNDFATINGSAITEGGNIVIEGGGGSDYLPQIDVLPETPEPGAVYNYKGVLVKYVEGAGKWGEWLGNSVNSINIKATPGNGVSLTYATEIPSSLDGQMLCRSRYFTSSIIEWYLDLTNNRLIGKVNDTDTYYVVKDGASINVTVSFYSQNVAWTGNKITFVNTSTAVGYPSVYPLVDQTCSVDTTANHYELFQPASPTFNSISSGRSTTVFVTEDGRISSLGLPIVSSSTRVNASYRGFAMVEGGTNFPNMSVPETTGATGSLCVASGGWTAPVWKTVVEALGVDFWTGTQAEYDALASHSSTTLYFIKDV